MPEHGPDPGSEEAFHAPSGDPTEVTGQPTEPTPIAPESPHYHEIGSAAGEIVSFGVDHARAALDGLREHAADRHARSAEAHLHTEAVHQQLAIPAQNRRAGRPNDEGTRAELAPRTYSERERAARVNRRESRALVVGSGPQYRKEAIWGDRIRTMDYKKFMDSIRAERPGPLGFLERWRARGAKKKYDADNRFIEKQYEKIDKAAYGGGAAGRARGFLGRHHQRRAEALGGTQPTTRATEEERQQAIANYRNGYNSPQASQKPVDESVSPLAQDMKDREATRRAQLAAVPEWKAQRDAEMARIAATPSYIHSYDHPFRPPDYPETKPGYGPEGITLDNVHRLTEEIEQAVHEAGERRVNEILTDVRDGKLSEEDQARMLLQDGETWKLAPIEAHKLREKVEDRKLARFLNVAITEIGQPDSIARREELEVRNHMKRIAEINRHGERGPRRERAQREELQPPYLSPEAMHQYAEHLDPERLDEIVADIIDNDKIQNAHAARRDKYLNENKMNLLVKKGTKYNLVQSEAWKVVYEIFDQEIAEDLGITVEELNQPDAPTKEVQAYLRYELTRRLAAAQNRTKTDETE